MYYVLYIDVLFLENLLLDYLLLTITARLMKLAPGRLRKILSAALGSLLLCLVYVFLPQCPLPVFLLIHAAIAAAMVFLGLKIRGPRALGRALILLYLCSFLLGGIFGWLKNAFQLPVYPFLGLSLLSYWLLSLGMEWLMRFRQKERHMYLVTLSFHGRSVRARGLVDTGNSLRDPVFGRPVSIVNQEVKSALCGSEEVLFCPVPFHSLGAQNGLLPTFYADFLQIETAGEAPLRVERPLLGVTNEPLSSKKEYDLLLHPALLEQNNFSGGNEKNAD